MLLDKTIEELSTGLKQKLFSIEELVQECYENIQKYNPKLNAFITIINKKEALRNAREKDKNISRATSKLYGIPFLLKDAYITKGIKTTAASFVLKNYIPQYNATVYQKLLDAGAILLGKMNMDAWGHGGSSENTDFGPVRNPWDLTRVAGGSSGGPAAAISSRMAVFAIGEDTGGSIRNPAAWCNITGLKVTYGRVSRYGTIAYASSFDTVGPMAKSVGDCAQVLEVIAGKDMYDATSSSKNVPRYSELIDSPVENLILGIPKEFFQEGLNTEIKNCILNSTKIFEKSKIKIKHISMPMFDYGLPVYYLIGPSETSSNLARYDGIRYGQKRKEFTSETVRRIMIGTYALSSGYYDAYYKKAQKARTLFIKEYDKALSECDVLLMPVTPTPPTKIGELMTDPLQNLLADVYTVSQNPVGVPSLAIPCGFTKNGLPIGMQLVGSMFSEDLLLRVGHIYQKATDWHKKYPKLEG
ncbi:Asp-tRNA(Asn)/Glu-tRNA(Gln) amidotransferase GatCAB subunit A [Candidatus Gottesmanbacteria bacterium CG11_big_fil_rev_8_21_14_0_20_37_11]|uniref:Glutamyl-tRNA(Gln) amidotransferase subunit A n=3 Tax=Candidatus Gottesmaniibacteriota TaxID=1752720 RepID=A0A2M7RSN3_9BACT|nr:MAG: glutaminyl-tRNA synthase (glutamine-hydrolyzing) subunit A [Candidatus Gottesmanbacteria bacterium CG1_02_37_22]PIP32915.1 MAG: Asp-tRNA(Asn)/Glu-tRNA(Gln) amidotransferase GatCAB subunit A [Candidatus Gottesmanbacteria bacterium CG23_combo_of_CG06-09_8_20_14_all_37_19]PIR07955.1 MAG: Asp-tRNA(Asn)/Glu-tRNA(Gln) amidotransferase GatCAB subunit A [Candidatus Gottesmanbacteria bacterium CG11_big_fil_rev_8_21_14_0_20_37_11]PIZ03230.1 MAG: Asp-tRNA(Asn)/Glu-tRNA(Gln) amidotransferase GatCAB 